MSYISRLPAFDAAEPWRGLCLRPDSSPAASGARWVRHYLQPQDGADPRHAPSHADVDECLAATRVAGEPEAALEPPPRDRAEPQLSPIHI